MRVGPDGARYLALAQDQPVPRPFHLRWVLPFFCEADPRKWWFAWFAGWVTSAVGMFAWRIVEGDGWQYASAATVVLLALPGILGPSVVIPVGVDLPSTGLTLCAVALCATGQPHLIACSVILLCWTAGIKETAPVFAALWAWSPWPLVALVAVWASPSSASPTTRSRRRSSTIAASGATPGSWWRRGDWVSLR